MTHTIAKGCGCERCKEPFVVPPFIGVEESERRQAAYEARRRLNAMANGIAVDPKPIRGA